MWKDIHVNGLFGSELDLRKSRYLYGILFNLSFPFPSLPLFFVSSPPQTILVHSESKIMLHMTEILQFSNSQSRHPAQTRDTVLVIGFSVLKTLWCVCGGMVSSQPTIPSHTFSLPYSRDFNYSNDFCIRTFVSELQIAFARHFGPPKDFDIKLILLVWDLEDW